MAEKTVRVKLLQGAAGPVWSAGAGEVVWLEEGEAAKVVGGGFGEFVDEGDGVEAEAAGVVEAAVVEEATAPVEGVERAVGVRGRSVVRKAGKRE